MKSFLEFLAHNKRYWIPPIVVFVAVLVYLAWKTAQAPQNPYDYRSY